ncbi:hypothetical protein [Providencia burhodogranariea]|uniref:Uncharacterized protein n=1 Tax=Providencia burhodogranariea DSM 19968 TaxID=1141662 RepID=K8X4J3_9GAMM|nr:hypothetical protein [Providencia burhodogranariea]EKT64592.1 hypothetical protein OOA_02307 [Providencia burhodogranariea DSM 19968]
MKLINYIRAFAFHNVRIAVELAEEKKSKNHIQFAKEILQIKNSSKKYLNVGYDKFHFFNNRLNQLSQVNLSVNNSNHVDYYKSVHMEEIINHVGEKKLRNLGYISNFMGKNNPGLVIHGSNQGYIYVYSGLEKEKKIIDNKLPGQFMSLPQFVNFLIEKHNLNELMTDKRPLHFICCYSGKAENNQKKAMAQELANILNRPIISYGGHEAIYSINQDHGLQEMLDNTGSIVINQDGEIVKAETQFLMPESRAPKAKPYQLKYAK